MKVLKTVRKIGDIIYKVYSIAGGALPLLFRAKHVLPMLFGSFSADSMMGMYCNEDRMGKSPANIIHNS